MQIDELPPAALTTRSVRAIARDGIGSPDEQLLIDDGRRPGPTAPLSLPDQARNRLSALLVVVFLALPVSELVGLLDLRLGVLPLGLHALEYWVMVALVAVSCVCSEAD